MKRTTVLASHVAIPQFTCKRLLSNMATPAPSKIIANALANSDLWDNAASTYPKADSAKFKSMGCGAECWDAVVTNKDNIKVLDIACGSGALSMLAAYEIKETGGQVVATDFSPKMIESLKETINQSGLTNIQARVENGMDLKSEDNVYDYAFSLHGMIFFPDFSKGLSEAYRVLKPGGKLVTTTATSTNTMMSIGMEMLKRHNRPTSILSFLQMGENDKLKQKLIDAGFQDVKTIESIKEMNITSHEMFSGFRDNPGFVSIRMELDISVHQFDKEVLEIVKELFPVLPTTSANKSLFGIGTKPEN